MTPDSHRIVRVQHSFRMHRGSSEAERLPVKQNVEGSIPSPDAKNMRQDNTMSLLQAVTTRTRAVINAFVGNTVNAAVSAGRGVVDLLSGTLFGAISRVSRDRTRIHKDMDQMDKDDPVVSFALSTIASRALGLEDPTLDAFTVTAQPETREDGTFVDDATITRANWRIRSLIKRLSLQNESWQIGRRLPKYGNENREVVIDYENMRVGAFPVLPEHTVFPNIDQNGHRIPGYTQNAQSFGKGMVSFEEREIVHFAFGEIDGYVGTPLLGCARKMWKRLNLAEDATAQARLTRSFMKLVHKIPVGASDTPESQKQKLKDYKDAMSTRPLFNQDLESLEREDWAQTVSTDLYLPDDGTQRGSVEMLDPENAQLQNIEDIKYFLDRLICATHIPKRYYPFESGNSKLSEGGGNTEDKNFACLLVMVQNVIKQGFSKLFDIELILAGINPEDVRYVFKMADINTTDQFRISQTRLNDAKTVELMSKVVPGIRNHIDVIVTEYMRLGDASNTKLLSDKKLGEGAPIDTGAPSTDTRPRVTMPGAGAGSDGRTQV